MARTFAPERFTMSDALVAAAAAATGAARRGAGANFAHGCDIVGVARWASFIQAFSKIGLTPGCGGTWPMPRRVGRARPGIRDDGRRSCRPRRRSASA